MSDWPATRTSPPDGGLFAPPPGLECEAERLNGQCLRILERLRKGPATNSELVEISIKYTGRISDLRKAGYVIECFERDGKTGLSKYRLVSSPPSAEHLDRGEDSK